MIYFNLELLLVKHQTFRSKVGNFPFVFLAEFFCSPNQSNTFVYIILSSLDGLTELLLTLLIYSLQITEPDKQTSVSSGMESELVNQGDDRTTQNNQHEEKTEDRKEPSHTLSRRRSSPSSRQRNYRKRSVSESPEKSPPRRSPENSPSSRKRSRNSDFRGNILRYLI